MSASSASTLVTGAAGFVGRTLVAHLLARGSDVRAVFEPGEGAAVRARLERAGARVVEARLDDEDALVAALRGVEVLVHAAEVPQGRGTLREHERVNLIAVEAALAAGPRAGVRRMVLLSSEAVTAGDYPRDHVDEAFAAPDTHLDHYGRTKALAEDLLLTANGAAGMETVALRPGWLWGPGDDALLPELIRRRRAKTLVLVGGGRNFVPTSYVSNVCDAVVLASATPAAAGAVYYVTDGERVTCRAFISRLLGAALVPAPVKSVPYRVAYLAAWWAERTGRPGALTRADVVRLGRPAFFNQKRAHAELGYVPAVTVAAGIAKVTEWVRDAGGADRVARGEPADDAIV